MAARDLFVLDSSFGARLIRLLYGLALLLIAVVVVLGVVRGVAVMSRPPMPRMAMVGQAGPGATAPNADTAQQPQPGAQPRHFPGRHFMMRQRFRRFRPLGPLGLGPLPRNPLLGGLLIILGTLLRGAILVMVVRILAELELAVLAMPRRAEI